MSLKTLVQKAELAINGQDWEVAVELADEILLLAPENEDAMLIKAEALTHLDRVMESDILLDRVLERNPRCVMAYVLSVFNSMAVMDLQEALRFANKGLGIDPEDFDLVMSKAQLLYWLGDPEYKSWIEEARRINRDRTDDFMAFHWIEEVPPTHPASVTVNLLPQITDAMEEGHYEKAIRLIKDALGSSMEGLHDPRGLREVLRGLEVECHLCLGNMKKARKKVKKLLRANPKNPHAWYYKARLSFHSGNIQAALEETDQSIKVAEEEGLRHPDYYFMKAYLLEEMGDPEAAQRFIELGEEVGAENKEKFEKMLEGVPILGNAPTWDEIRVALMRFMMDNYPPEEFWDAVREGYPYEDDVFDEEGRALDKLDWFLYEYVRPETGRTPVREFAEKYGPPLRERILQMEDITHGRFEVVGTADSGDVIPGVVRLKGPGGAPL
jgi:tetratricopeptide (TPR) repeat protein